MSDKPTVVEALTAVMSDVQSVRKGKTNTDQGYKFRGVDDVVNAVGPVLRKHGVIVLPVMERATYRDVQTSRGKPSRESTVEVRYRFYGPAGDFVEAVVPGEAMDFGDKGVAKAMSVAYRIVLLQALCIPTDEPEPDAQSYERASAPTWDPVEQAAERDGWEQEIASAKNLEELGAVAERLRIARRGGRLSPPTVDHLMQAFTTHKSELERLAKEVTGE